MKLKDTFDALNRIHCFGFSPVSTSTKPAHVANGWFRRLLGSLYDPDLLNRVAVVPTSPEPKRAFTAEAIIEDFRGTFEPFLPQNRRRDFTDFRAAVKEVISPYAGAVNATNDFSAYNITHAKHLTRDRLDSQTGSFLYHLVSTDLGSGASPIVAIIRSALEDATDEITTLTLPLIHDAPASPVTEGTYTAPTVFQKRAGRFSMPLLQNLQEGFDRLAAFEESYGGGLDALRRAVAFGVFACLAFLPNRHRFVTKQSGLHPFLLYFQGRQQTTVYHTSHHTYNAVRQSLDSLYSHFLRQDVIDRVGERPTVKRCEKFIREEVEFPKEQEKNTQRLLQNFQVYHPQNTCVDALADAIRDTYTRTLNSTPSDVFRTVGVRIGWIRPGGNRATRKYFTLEGVLLQAVLASVLPHHPLPFQEFCSLLHAKYGLVIGGRQDDADLLKASGFGQATVEDLRANAQTFRRHLLDLGWARQYADGILYVQLPEGMQ